MKPTKPKVVTTQSPNLQIVGQKINEAISTKHLSKSPSTPNPDPLLNYTFQRTEPIEKHATSGGFKIPQGNYGKVNPSFPEKNTKMSEKKKFHEKKLSKKEMFEELGFSGVGEKDKTGNSEQKENILINEEPFTDIQFLETLKNRRDVADLVIENIEKNVGKLQLHREKLKMREKSLRERNNRSESSPNNENVIIYDDFDRSQIVSHVISTNENPTIQNVESLLQAHQQRMKELQHQYMEKKIRKIDKYDHSSNKERTNSSHSKPKTDNENIPDMMTINVRNVPLPKQIRDKQRKENSQNFSFMPQKQITPKSYERDFRRYLEKKNDKNKEFQQEDGERSPENLIFRRDGPIKQRKVDINTVPKEELELMEFFFEDIPQKEPDVISKNDLIEYLKKNEKILDLYDLDPNELKRELDNFYTASSINITFNEFVTFLKNPRVRTFPTESSAQDDWKPSTLSQKFIGSSNSNINFLTENDFAILERIYSDLDRHQDFIVPVKELMKKIRNDVQIGRILDEPMIYLAKIGKMVTLDRALYQLEREGRNSEERKEKEYISWNYFKDFLKNYSLKPFLVRGNTDDPEISEEDSIKIDKTIFEAIENCYKKTHKTEGFCKVSDLIAEIQRIKRFEFLADTTVRTKAPSSRIKSESLRDILKRIEVESDEYVDFDEFLEFFTGRGRPKSLLILDGKERKKFYHEKIQGFLRKKNRSPKKVSSPTRKRTNQKKLESNPSRSKLGSPKIRLNSQESPRRKLLYNGSSGKLRMRSNSSERHSSKLRLTSQSSEHDRDVISTKRNNNRIPIERSLSWDDIKQEKASPYGKRQDASPGRDTRQIGRSPHNKKGRTPAHSKDKKQGRIPNEASPNYNRYGRSQHNIKLITRSPKDGQRTPMYGNQHRKEPYQKDLRSKDVTPMYQNEEIRIIDGYDSDPEYRMENRVRNNRNLSLSDTKKRGQNALKITVPKPFEFDERDRIRKQEQEETMKQLKKPNEKKGFKANPIPEFVKQRNLLEKINKEQEARREEIKKNSRIITMQREKPFSFYARDIKKQEIRRKNKMERKKFQFKANAVPWFCSVKLFDIMNEEERAKREERVSKNAQISLNMSKLPPRMEKHEQEKKAYELKYGPQYRQINYDEDCTFKPKSPKKVPNFKRLQNTFQNLLDNKRRNYRPTKAVSPNFQESKRQKKVENYEEEEAKRQKILRMKKEKTIDTTKPVYQPPSTKKWESALEKAKNEREIKENAQREKEKQELERQQKYNKIKSRVQNSNAIVDNRKALKEKKEVLSNQIQEKLKNDNDRFVLWKKEMNEKISQRPLLVETATKRDKAFEKMQQLARMHKIMTQTGLKNKDIFSAEERELLADLEFLKKHNMLKDIL